VAVRVLARTLSQRRRAEVERARWSNMSQPLLEDK
jgi:hypothetical protein